MGKIDGKSKAIKLVLLDNMEDKEKHQQFIGHEWRNKKRRKI